MISVLLIGNGNVATHLFNAFLKADTISVTKISSRNLNKIPIAAITIIAVSDDVIPEISAKIENKLVVHTSGNVALNSLINSTKKGVFYPLQTFSKNRKVNFDDVPFCIEAQNESDLRLLSDLAKSIGKKVFHVTTEQRKSLHVAAVFVNNFTNHLYKIGNDICQKNNVPFEVLQPLILETAQKIAHLSPENAQTGPAKRKDKITIKNHLQLLDKNQQEIYKILTKSIQNGEKL